MTFEEILVQFKTAKPLLLMRAKNAPFIISFFHKVFADANITTITNSELRSKLEGYMEELSYEEKDEELEAGTLFDDFSVRAAQYIDKWSNSGFLSKYPNDDGEDLHELTSDTRKVLKWLGDLEKRSHVGTNSRFKDIFFKLQKMIEQTNEDAEARVEELSKRLMYGSSSITIKSSSLIFISISVYAICRISPISSIALLLSSRFFSESTLLIFSLSLRLESITFLPDTCR